MIHPRVKIMARPLPEETDATLKEFGRVNPKP